MLDISNKIRFFCPKCCNHIAVPVKYNLTVEISEDTKVWMYEPPEMLFGRYCENCGTEMVTIDKELFGKIITLNKLCYYTLSCCEGHLSFNYGQPNDFPYNSTPYIMFAPSNKDFLNIDGYSSCKKYMSKLSESVLMDTVKRVCNPDIVETSMMNFGENDDIKCFYLFANITDDDYKFINKHKDNIGLNKFDKIKKSFLNEIDKLIKELQPK